MEKKYLGAVVKSKYLDMAAGKGWIIFKNFMQMGGRVFSRM